MDTHVAPCATYGLEALGFDMATWHPGAMELAQLRYLRVIAKEGSISAAARALGLSQPSLSVAVKQLEADLGTSLLVRTRTGVTLTAAGEEAVRVGGELLGAVQALRQRVADLEHGAVGEFVVGCHESLGAYFLPSFLPGFLAAHPAISLHLWNGSSKDVAARVVDGEVTFGLVVNATPHPDLVIVPAWEDRIELVIAEEPPCEGDRWGWALDRLATRPLVYMTRWPFAGIVDRLAAANVPLNRLIPCGDLELTKSLTIAGVGVGVLPRRVARYGAGGGLAPLHPALPRFDDTIHLVYRADVPRTRAHGLLKDALLAHARGLDGR